MRYTHMVVAWRDNRFQYVGTGDEFDTFEEALEEAYELALWSKRNPSNVLVLGFDGTNVVRKTVTRHDAVMRAMEMA
jgi:hypothetical protein